ncbi:MAG: FAD-linked oxidoreductase [Pseudonocardiales bacterium]|nr:FAD-binding oxidoreductase [Pseudonocardiales bacterium]PZS23058.1 MAG: FAD-linked oxidoreductase [Pseudonocardiales bacterium]
MSGPVFIPGDMDYHSARSIWNGDIDRHPAVIARCQTQQDVVTAVGFAQREGLEIAVRGGGHGYSGLSVCEGGLVIDLSGMRDVVVDPDSRRAVVGGGARLADLDAATQAHGLAVTGGVVGHTGVAGLTLGGGMGWLTRKLGLSIDNLEAAEVVLADGRRVRACADSHPNLFWALRGGGGNFGVVTSFEFRLHPVGPEVHFALLFWGIDRGHDALRTARDAIPALPENTASLLGVAMAAPPAPFVPEQHHFAPGHALLLVGFGSAEEHTQAVAPIRAACPPLFEFITPIPYTALQQMFDDSAFPWGIRAYSKALYLDELSDEAINVLVEGATNKTSPMSFMPIFRLDGAFAQVGEQDTAFGGTRTPQYAINIEAISPDPAALAADRNWVRSVWDALRPHAASAGGYVNFSAEQDYYRVRATYGSTKYDRLALIKTQYDPGNVFHRNANITPSQQRPDIPSHATG